MRQNKKWFWINIKHYLLPLVVFFFTCVISGFRREAVENRALLGYCAASSDNLLPTFRDEFRSQFQGSSIPEDGADRFFHNVSNKLPLFAA